MPSYLSAYASPVEHAAVSDIIRRHSTNRADVREVALAGLDLAGVRDVLDMGCGFGFMSEAVARRCAQDAVIHGVDTWADNGPPFAASVRRTGRRAEFTQLCIRDRLPWPDRSFDLVLASFTLYFFVEILPEVARVLRPRGLFLAVTHYRDTMANVVRAVGLRFRGTPLERMMRSFCAENALENLRPWFQEVRSVDYPNTLEFLPDHRQDLLRFAVFKLPQLLPNGEVPDGKAEAISRGLLEHLDQEGRLVVEKSDTAFHCRGPLCP
jgi:SAM-dependent methyltransferase